MAARSGTTRTATGGSPASSGKGSPDRCVIDRLAPPDGAGRDRGAGPGRQGHQPRRRPAGAASQRRLGARQERPAGARQRRRSGRSCRPRAPLVRLRLINACNARMLLLARADGRPLQVIAHDGHLLEAPRPLDEVLLTPAQRLDLLLALDGAGPVELLHKPYNRGAQREPSRPEPLFSVHPPARSAPPPCRRASRRSSGSTRGAVAVRRSFRMAMAFLAADGQQQLGADRGAAGRSGALGDHQRRHPGSRLSSAHLAVPGLAARRRRAAEPGWRDTINLVPGERVELLIPFRDFAGRSVFHCHIAEHGDAGMMGIIEVRGPAVERAEGPHPGLRRRDLPVGVIRAGVEARRTGRPASSSGPISPRARSSSISRARVARALDGERLPARRADLGRRERREARRDGIAAIDREHPVQHRREARRRRAWRGRRPAPASGSRGRPASWV